MKALELAGQLEGIAYSIPTDRRGWTEGGEPQNACTDAAAELRRLTAVEVDCAPYLKEGETPAERIKRALGDADSLMTLYRDVVAERDALKAELERIKALPPAAWQHKKPLVNDFGNQIGYTDWQEGKGLELWPHRQLYALGSQHE